MAIWDIGRFVGRILFYFSCLTIMQILGCKKHFRMRVKVGSFLVFFDKGDITFLGSARFEDDMCSKPEGRRYNTRHVT
jgi:hypothetical protein